MALTPTTPSSTNREESLFNDPAVMNSLITAAFGQLIPILEFLENEHMIDVSSDPQFSAANNLTAAYLMWKMKDPAFFELLPDILSQGQLQNSMAGSTDSS